MSERAGRPTIHVLDQDWKTNDAFWKVFGGKESVNWIKSPHGGGNDEDFWRDKSEMITLWKVNDTSGKVQITKISQGNLNVSDLDTKDAFILDAVSGGIFVWIGKECTDQERKKAMEYGQEYLGKQIKRSGPTEVIRVLEGAEPSRFSQWFSNWDTKRKTSKFVPKLFQCSNESGKLHVEEIANFYQEDLDGDDVMIWTV